MTQLLWLQKFDVGSRWATCPLIMVPWSRPRFRWGKASYQQPKRQIFKKKSAGKRSRLLGRGHFATNMWLLLLFDIVHGTRCPFLPLLLPRSVLCRLQYVVEKKSSECCFLLFCVVGPGSRAGCCPPRFCCQPGATRALTQPISGARYRTTCVNCVPRG